MEMTVAAGSVWILVKIETVVTSWVAAGRVSVDIEIEIDV